MPLKLNSTGGGSVSLDAPSTASTFTLTLPAANATVATTTGTLTNPTINGFTGNTAVVNIGPGQIYKDTLGNVGIGTTSVNKKLVVSNAGAAEIGLDPFGRSGETASSLLSYNRATSAYIPLHYDASVQQFYISGTERVRIDASGNVGIGTSSPAQRLEVSGSVSGFVGQRINNTSGANGAGVETGLELYNSSNYLFRLSAFRDTNEVRLNNASVGVMSFYTSNAERARIDSNGNLLAGTTVGENARVLASISSNMIGLRVQNSLTSGTTTDMFQVVSSQVAGSGFYHIRTYSSGSVQFGVRGDGVVFAQNTTIQSLSDARVKENVRVATDGLDTILNLRPVRFDFKEGHGNDKKNQLGFIAQEIEQVFPDAVDEMAEVSGDGDNLKSVGTGILIPVLVKAIQEQQAQIESLTARIAQLEAK